MRIENTILFKNIKYYYYNENIIIFRYIIVTFMINNIHGNTINCNHNHNHNRA